MKANILIAVILFGVASFSAKILKKHPLSKVDALKDFIEIKAGNVTLNSEQYQIDAFYISKFEVTNQKYQEFLDDLNQKGRDEALAAAQINNENWDKLNVEWDIEEKYHSYKGFASFPVVNVSFEGAQLYCQWLTKKVNREIESDYTVEFRLPTRNEWIRAARGETTSIYAWHHPYLQNGEGKLLCNFKRLGAERIHFNTKTNAYEIVDPYDGPTVLITTKVEEFPPNEFGLYNICGNVAEMTAEKGIAVGGSFNSPGYDVRVESKESYQDPSPFVGFRPIMILKSK